MAFTKFELLTSPSSEKIGILSILFLTTQRDPRKFPASTAVPVLGFPSSYLKVPNIAAVQSNTFKGQFCWDLESDRCSSLIGLSGQWRLLHEGNEPFCLRNRKRVPCFYQLIETWVEVWRNEKCCGNTSHRRMFPQLFRVLPNFHECFYNSIETHSTHFLFLLENTVTKKRKTTC